MLLFMFALFCVWALVKTCFFSIYHVSNRRMKTPKSSTNKIEKWELIPYFMQLRNVINQHIFSFNHFVQEGMRNILLAEANVEIRSSADPEFYMRYIDIKLGAPSVLEDHLERSITPFECRVRDLTYSGLTSFFFECLVLVTSFCFHLTPI